MKIVNIKKVDSEPVYDINVKDVHHYILENGVITHNSGAKYAASTIIYFSKSKDRDGTEVKGVFLKGKVDKGRLSKENTTGVMTLNYQTGLDKYSGLLELGEKHGVFKKVAGRYEINGGKVFAKAIHDNPEKYFTKEVMDQLEIAAQKEYKYGIANDIEEETETIE